MSKVTLETLRADFIKEMRISKLGWAFQQFLNRYWPWAAYWHSASPHHLKSIDQWAMEYDGLWASPSSTCGKARMYVIARDHGLDAAMLYKLSDGQIDPRNP